MTRVAIVARPIELAAYQAYGELVRAGAGDSEGEAANLGTARRYGALSSLENMRGESARPNVSVFRSTPWHGDQFNVTMLEKHPLSTQLFVPMNARRYLVVVAEGASVPDLATLRAFVVDGKTGITYRPGVWHHPIVALDQEIDFVSLVWEVGGDGDCVEWPASAQITVDFVPKGD